MTVPPLAEVKVTAKWPAASVVPVNGPAGLAVAPLLFVSVTVTVSPAAGDEARAVARVLLEGGGEGVRRVDLVEGVGRDRDLALTQVLIAGPELPPVPLVARVSDTPPTVSVVWAVTVEVPVAGDVIVVVHDRPPVVVQWVGGFGVEVAPLHRRS